MVLHYIVHLNLNDLKYHCKCFIQLENSTATRLSPNSFIITASLSEFEPGTPISAR